jgi:hypothetical protein
MTWPNLCTATCRKHQGLPPPPFLFGHVQFPSRLSILDQNRVICNAKEKARFDMSARSYQCVAIQNHKEFGGYDYDYDYDYEYDQVIYNMMVSLFSQESSS